MFIISIKHYVNNPLCRNDYLPNGVMPNDTDPFMSHEKLSNNHFSTGLIAVESDGNRFAKTFLLVCLVRKGMQIVCTLKRNTQPVLSNEKQMKSKTNSY